MKQNGLLRISQNMGLKAAVQALKYVIEFLFFYYYLSLFVLILLFYFFRIKKFLSFFFFSID